MADNKNDLLNHIGWFFDPQTGTPESGTVIAERYDCAYIACGRRGTKVYRIPVDEVFPSHIELMSWMEKKNQERLREFRDMMPDLNACLRFALLYPVSEYACSHPIAREAYITRVRELTGDDTFGQS